MPRRASGLIWVVLAVWATSCVTPRGDRIAAPTPGSFSSPDRRASGLSGQGRLVVAAGRFHNQAHLFDIDDRGEARSVDPAFLVSEIATCRGGIVVTGARLDGGFAVDQLYEYDGVDLDLFRGLDSPLGHGASLSRDCDVAYIEQGAGCRDGEMCLRVVRRTGGSSEWLSRGLLYGMAWTGPDEIAIVVPASGEGRSVLILGSEGVRSKISPRIRHPGSVQAGGQWIAVANANDTELIHRDGRRAFLRGWRARDMTRDGRRLLLTNGTELGVLTLGTGRAPSDGDIVRAGPSRIGTIFMARWVIE